MTGKSQAESGEIERRQATALANAASKTSGLEHYIWSTLVSATKRSNGKYPVPHMDYKAEVDEYIKQELPQLAKKTTYLQVGWYPSNIAFLPVSKPIEWPGSYGAYIWIHPTTPDSGIYIAGDMNVTTGIWVKAILEQPDKTYEKYVSQATDYLTWAEILEVWSKVTGKRASILQVSYDDFVRVWGPLGAEYAEQLKFGEILTLEDWKHLGPGPHVSNEELGIDLKGIGLEDALEAFHAAGLLA